jgi:hypothetical protein
MTVLTGDNLNKYLFNNYLNTVIQASLLVQFIYLKCIICGLSYFFTFISKNLNLKMFFIFQYGNYLLCGSFWNPARTVDVTDCNCKTPT